jgi:hypothetical protein
MRRSSIRVIAVALAAGVVLSACSSTDRSAAPAEDVVATEQSTESVEELVNEPELAEEADQELASESDVDELDAGEAQPELDGAPEGERAGSSIRGSRICVINNRTTRDRRTAWIDVKFTIVDRVSRESTFIAPGDQICGESAHNANPAMVDVAGVVTAMYDSTKSQGFAASNRVIGFPDFALFERGSGRECYYSNGGDWGFQGVDDSVNRFTMRRLPDSARFKEFTITVSDGEKVERSCDSD